MAKTNYLDSLSDPEFQEQVYFESEVRFAPIVITWKSKQRWCDECRVWYEAA